MVRRGTVLVPSDRRMLQAVRDNLSHVRHAAAGSTLPRRLDPAVDMAVQNSGLCVGGEESVASSRLNYNKKAMNEIRQSLQNYHVTPASYETMSHNVSTDNLINQVMFLNQVSSSDAWLTEHCLSVCVLALVTVFVFNVLLGTTVVYNDTHK